MLAQSISSRRVARVYYIGLVVQSGSTKQRAVSNLSHGWRDAWGEIMEVFDGGRWRCIIGRTNRQRDPIVDFIEDGTASPFFMLQRPFTHSHKIA